MSRVFYKINKKTLYSSLFNKIGTKIKKIRRDHVQGKITDLPHSRNMIHTVNMAVIATLDPIAFQKIKDLVTFKAVPYRRKMKKNQDFYA